jgi:hypothetical protein
MTAQSTLKPDSQAISEFWQRFVHTDDVHWPPAGR